MKKILYPVLALGAIATLASCASDEPINVKEYDGTARFSIRLPNELATRFNDGTNAHKLYYSVFQDGKYVLDGVITDAFSNNLTQEVGIQLVANQEYQIVFFADNAASESNGYTYDPRTAQFDVTYSNEMVNSDDFDAFVNTITYTATGEGTDVPLKRPFAQLNIGTNDLDNGAVEHIGLDKFSSTLTIQPTNILSGINFLSGEQTAYTGNALSFSISSFASLPDDVFPVDNYKYIEMNYLLVPSTGEGQNSLIDATYVIEANGTTGNTLNLASTPVKPNYQTNVYGSLLTTQNKFNVEIKPAFDGELDRVVIDGVSYKTANNADVFTACLESGEPVYVPAGTTIDLSEWNPTTDNRGAYIISENVNLLVDGQISGLCVPLVFKKNVTISGAGSINLTKSVKASTTGFLNFEAGESKISGITIDAMVNNDKIFTLGVASIISQENVRGRWENVSIKSDKCGGVYSLSSDFEFYDCVFECLSESQTASQFLGDFNVSLNDCVLSSPFYPLGFVYDGKPGAKGVVNGGAIISTSEEFQPYMPAAIGVVGVDVAINDALIHVNNSNCFGVVVSDTDANNEPAFMNLTLSNVRSNAVIGQYNWEGSVSNLSKPVEGDFFSIIDASISSEILGTVYTFPWIINGQYQMSAKP